MQEIRIKVEDGIPWALACDLVASDIDEIDEADNECAFTHSDPVDDMAVNFKRGKSTLNFKVCKIESK